MACLPQRTLLTQLAAAGAQPWRYGMQDYLAAVPAINADNRHPLSGALIQADWDVGLGAKMLSCGCAIDEEGVVDVLLAELANHAD